MERPLTLNMDETMLLTDRVKNDAKDEGKEIGKRFLLKLATCYMQLVGDSASKDIVTIYGTEPEAWLARSLFNSGERTDRDAKLGIHILRKLYQILIDFDTAEQMGNMPDAEEGDHAFCEMKRAKHISDPDADLEENDFLAGAA